DRFPFISAIEQDFRDRYKPAFRKGTAVWSDSMNREVKASEATYAPDKALLAKLATIPGAPTNKKGETDTGELLKLFWSSAKVAWRSILDSLPDEDDQQ